jgi:chromosome segregation ATPase
VKLSVVCAFALTIVFVGMPQKVLAQTSTTTSKPTVEQSLQELVKELRQLRTTLQKMNAAVYKGQVMLERVKLQQEQVSRMTRELNDVRENLIETRSHQSRLKELVTRTEALVESGTKHPGELAAVKTELDMLNQRETQLAARETRLVNELELERARLNDLNDRLSGFELEMVPR